MSNTSGPVAPRDSTTVLTRSYDAVHQALKFVNVTPAGAGSIIALTEAPRLATVHVDAVALGGNSDFVITADVDGVSIPNKIYAPQIIIVPSAATIAQLRLFGTSARLGTDPIWYQRDYPPFDVTYVNDATGFWYINRDGAVANQNRIFGNIAVDAGASNPASFDIFLLFVEGRTPV